MFCATSGERKRPLHGPRPPSWAVETSPAVTKYSAFRLGRWRRTGSEPGPLGAVGDAAFPVLVRVFTGGPWLTHASVPKTPCSSCSGGSGGPGRVRVSPAAVRHPLGLLPGAGRPSDGRRVCVASLKGCGGRPAGRGEAVPDQGTMGRESGRPGGLGHVLKLRAPSHAFCSVRKSRARPEHPGRAHATATGGRARSGFHGGPTTEDPRRWRPREVARRGPRQR